MSPGAITLLTTNLWNGAGCPDALARLLDLHAPDVVLAQELDERAAEVLSSRYDSTLLRPRRDTFGMGLAVRGPAELRELPMPRRNFLAARLRPAGWPPSAPPLEVINVHLSCPDRWPRLPERRTQVRRLQALARADPRPRVMAGDFNTAIPMPAYFDLRRGRVDAAWQVAQRSRDLLSLSRSWPRPTWGPTANAPRIARIDHVLLEQLQASKLTNVRIPGSDHDAVMATVRPLT